MQAQEIIQRLQEYLDQREKVAFLLRTMPNKNEMSEADWKFNIKQLTEERSKLSFARTEFINSVSGWMEDQEP